MPERRRGSSSNVVVAGAASPAAAKRAAGRRTLARDQWQGVRDRLDIAVRKLGGRQRAADALGVSLRTVEGWLSQSWHDAKVPDAPSLVLLGRHGFSPQWVLFGTELPHPGAVAPVSDTWGAEVPPLVLATELRRFVADALRKAGSPSWRVAAYLPSGEDLLSAFVGAAADELERRRMWKRERLAEALHEALEAGAANGYAPALAMRFAAAFHEAQGGENPDGHVVVHPVFSLAVTDGDGVHDETPQRGAGRPVSTKPRGSQRA